MGKVRRIFIAITFTRQNFWLFFHIMICHIRNYRHGDDIQNRCERLERGVPWEIIEIPTLLSILFGSRYLVFTLLVAESETESLPLIIVARLFTKIHKWQREGPCHRMCVYWNSQFSTEEAEILRVFDLKTSSYKNGYSFSMETGMTGCCFYWRVNEICKHRAWSELIWQAHWNIWRRIEFKCRSR